MKTRVGFVSNSSSSSFLVYKKNISITQLYMIRNHIEAARELLDWATSKEDEWDITETVGEVRGSTTMNNFDMEIFLEELEIPAIFEEE